MRPFILTAVTVSVLVGLPAFADHHAEPNEAAPPVGNTAEVPESANTVEDQAPTFEITNEADLPEGWPEAGPAFEVSVKEYPQYRVAVAEGRGAFFLLFAHIQSNEIPMTAPVEMQMQQAPRGYEMVNMGFLYQSTEVGRTGEDGAVEVIDVPAMTVVSYGTNGPTNRETWDNAIEQIEAVIADLEGWQSTGQLRMLGYNSPMIPEGKRYYEVQVIVEPVDADADAPDQAQAPVEDK